MKESDLESEELETVISSGGVPGKSADGDMELLVGEAKGEAMGLSGESASAEDESAVNVLTLDATVKSLVTLHVLRGTTGVPRDCWLRWVASLWTSWVGG